MIHIGNVLLILLFFFPPSSLFRDERFKVMDHAQFPEHVSIQPVKTEVLGLPSYSFLLHLSKTQTGHPTAMIIATDTRQELIKSVSPYIHCWSPPHHLMAFF